MSLVVLSLLVAVAAAAAAIAFATVRAVAVWRDVRRFTHALGEGLEGIADALERLDAFEPPDTERLTVAVARMNASRERLSVLTGALGRVRRQWTGLVAVYPKK